MRNLPTRTLELAGSSQASALLLKNRSRETIASRTDQLNLGVPLFADPRKDLAGKPHARTDSWYVGCSFRAGGRDLGFEWHQMEFVTGPQSRICSREFLLMDATRLLWLDHAAAEPVATGAASSAERCNVTSAFGTLTGDRDELRLDLNAPDGAVNVVLRPRQQVLYNGGAGVLPLMGAQSFQFSFPNMEVNGTVRLNDETIPIENAIAWFDRQWTYALPSGDAPEPVDMIGRLPSWLWLGMTLDSGAAAAISLWDMVYPSGERRAFATLFDEHGVQSNHRVNLRYHDIWQSERTGHRYPSAIDISIPSADLELSLDALLERPEFDHGKEHNGISGCQSPCAVRGRYGLRTIDGVVIVEMIGDVCGPL